MPCRKKRRTAQPQIKHEVPTPAGTTNAKWTFGDSVTVIAALVGVLLVIVAPPLYAKIPAFVGVCAAFIRFLWKCPTDAPGVIVTASA